MKIINKNIHDEQDDEGGGGYIQPVCTVTQVRKVKGSLWMLERRETQMKKKHTSFIFCMKVKL